VVVTAAGTDNKATMYLAVLYNIAVNGGAIAVMLIGIIFVI
jgi:hypothetical protein